MLTVATAVIIRMKLNKSKMIRHSAYKVDAKREIGLFKTVAIMQLGFSITLGNLDIILGGLFIIKTLITLHLVNTIPIYSERTYLFYSILIFNCHKLVCIMLILVVWSFELRDYKLLKF